MAVKAILILCAQALLVKSALGQCTSRAAVAAAPGLGAPLGLAGMSYGLAGPGLAYDGLAGPYGLAGSGLAYDGLAGPYGLAGPGLAYDGLVGGLAGRGLAYDGITGCGLGSALEFSPTSGGALPVSSASAIAPVGISVASENVYEGALAAAGELPFVGTVAVEGVLPTAGAGAINHRCGNGVNAMISGDAAFAPAAGIGALGAYGPAGIGAFGAYGAAGAIAPVGLAAPGLGYAGWAGRGCGCGI